MGSSISSECFVDNKWKKYDVDELINYLNKKSFCGSKNGKTYSNLSFKN